MGQFPADKTGTSRTTHLGRSQKFKLIRFGTPSDGDPRQARFIINARCRI
jgi:hypothetical protein